MEANKLTMKKKITEFKEKLNQRHERNTFILQDLDEEIQKNKNTLESLEEQFEKCDIENIPPDRQTLER